MRMLWKGSAASANYELVQDEERDVTASATATAPRQRLFNRAVTSPRRLLFVAVAALCLVFGAYAWSGDDDAQASNASIYNPSVANEPKPLDYSSYNTPIDRPAHDSTIGVPDDALPAFDNVGDGSVVDSDVELSEPTPVSDSPIDNTPLDIPMPDTIFESPANDSTIERPVHLILPATETKPNLCKTILTASVLGYPEPVLINWGTKPEGDDKTVSHLRKISGVVRYLAFLGPDRQDDLVLMTDAYDIWFNLPLKVLLERYDKQRREGDERIKQIFGQEAFDSGMRQTVIFAADKTCFGFDARDFWCWMQPESPLDVDTYASFTDTTEGFTKRSPKLQPRYSRSSFRPRYLNSGVLIGPVKDVLPLVLRAQEYVENGHGPGGTRWPSDQRILQMAHAEQQLWRYKQAKKNGWQADTEAVLSHIAPYAAPEESSDLWQHAGEIENEQLEDGKRYDFGIGIDYWSSISQTTVASDHEFAYLTYNTTPPSPEIERNHMFECKSGVSDLPADLDAMPPPFSNITLAALGAPPPTWRSVPLYTNLCTGEIPAIIHHNGDKAAREDQWSRLWLTAHARALLHATKQGSLDIPTNGGNVMTDTDGRLEWDDICGAFDEELFAPEASSA